MKEATKWFDAASVTKAKLNTDVAGTGITGGGGTALSLDINGLTGETATGVTDYLAIYDSSAAALRKMYSKDFLEWSTSPASDQTAFGNITYHQVDVNARGIGYPLTIASDGNLEICPQSSYVYALSLESGTGAGKKVLLQGFYRDDAKSWTVGGNIYLGPLGSTGAEGELTQNNPNSNIHYQTPVGIAITSTIIYFKPLAYCLKYYSESTGVSSKTGTTYTTKVSVSIPAGVYDIKWHCNLNAQTWTQGVVHASLYNVTDAYEYSHACADSYLNKYYMVSGMVKNISLSGTKTIAIQYAHGAGGTGKLVYIKNAYIEAIKRV